MSFCAAAVVLVLAFEDVTLDRIQALAKIYLRDSAEVPMSVDVTTVVTDPSGKVKHRGHMTAGMVFHGYSLGSGNFSLRATKGGLTPFGLGDSISGDLAAFLGGVRLFKTDVSKVEIRQPAETGKPVVVIVRDQNCPQLESMPKALFQKHLCGTSETALTVGTDGDLAMQHVSFDSTGAPAPVKVPHIGEAQLKSFHFGVDFQLKFLPGETKPYLWPLETIVSATTDKGTVTITNRYSAKR